MKIVIVAGQGTAFEKHRGIFQKKLEQCPGGDIVWLFRKKEQPGNFMTGLQELAPDLLVTVDLLGFEQRTLTDNLSYNIMDCKQVHLLLGKPAAGESCLRRQLSIAMFFYCVGDAYYRYLKEQYPHLPYLKQIQGWQMGEDERAAEKNSETVSAILREVIAECGMRA